MSRALAFLVVRSTRGRIVRMARRLRDPRYLVGFLVGAGWVLFWLSRVFGGGINFEAGIPAGAIESLGPLAVRALQLALALLMAVGLTLWWLIPLGGTGLELSEAELHLLLPAPVSRRKVIQYGVFRSQPGVLFGAAIMTFFSGGGSAVAVAGRFAGLWVLLSAWDLHAKGRGLWLARARELRAAAAWRRRSLLYAGMAVAWIVLATALADLAVEILAGIPSEVGDVEGTVRAGIEAHVESAWNGLVGWMLTPLLWITGPALLPPGAGTGTMLRAYALALIVLLAHYEWVVRSQVRFEEAALEHAERESRKQDPAARYWKLSSRRREWRPFRLAERASPEVAILWKNLMLIHRLPLRTMALLLLGAVGLLVTGLALAPDAGWAPHALRVGSALLVGLPPFFTGRSVRNDLRQDLVQLETIRPWPIDGWRLFVAEIAGPVTVALLQMIAGAALLIALEVVAGAGLLSMPPIGGSLGPRLGVPSAVVLPLLLAGWFPVGITVAALTTGVENLVAMMFPSWVQLGFRRRQAASRFGQNLLVFFVLSLATLIGLAPGALMVAAILGVQIGFWGLALSGWQLPFLGLAAALPTAGVVAGIAAAGGILWRRLDPSEELLRGGS